MTEPDRALSALNLRTVLATFGLVVGVVLAALAFASGWALLGAALVLMAVTAVVDLVVIVRRRRREPGMHRTLFE